MATTLDNTPEVLEMTTSQPSPAPAPVPAAVQAATEPPPGGGDLRVPKWLVYLVTSLALGGTTFSGVTAFKPAEGITQTEVELLISEHSHKPHDGVEAMLKASEDRAVVRAREAALKDRERDLGPMKKQLSRIEKSVDELKGHLIKSDRRRR